MSYYGAVPRGAYREIAKRGPNSLGFERYALRFDPTIPNYAEIPAAAVQLNFTAEDFSIIFGLYIDSLTTGQLPFCRGLHSEDGYYCYIDTVGRLGFRTSQLGAQQVSEVPVATFGTGAWYTAGISRNGATATLYKNGIDLTSLIGAHINPATCARSAKIGIYDDLGTYPFDGKMAFLMVYDIALTAAEMKWNTLNYHNPIRRDRLVLWLPMEEGTGLTLIDHSGYGSNASLKPALTPPTWERVRQWELRAQTK